MLLRSFGFATSHSFDPTTVKAYFVEAMEATGSAEFQYHLKLISDQMVSPLVS